MQSSHQELGLIHTRAHLLRLLILVLADIDFVAVDGVVVVIERDGPGEQDGPAADAADHGPVGRGLGTVLHYQLHGTGVKAVVDEAIVDPAVLDSDRTELKTKSSLVQCPSEGVVPLSDLVIVSEQPEPIV